MRAVVFDLFGTLTDPQSEVGRRAMVEETGAMLGVDPELFWDRWSSSFPDRITGRYGDTGVTLRRLLQECGAHVEQDAFKAALTHHIAAMEAIRSPRPGALEVLDELRRRGFRLALMSDCSSEVVESWDQTPYARRFDAAVLSWSEGLRKPDPRLYARAAARLGVKAEECWDVGDGGGREHSGAMTASMTPVLVTNAGTPSAASRRADPDDVTPVHRIDDLPELLHLVGAPSSSVP